MDVMAQRFKHQIEVFKNYLGSTTRFLTNKRISEIVEEDTEAIKTLFEIQDFLKDNNERGNSI